MVTNPQTRAGRHTGSRGIPRAVPAQRPADSANRQPLKRLAAILGVLAAREDWGRSDTSSETLVDPDDRRGSECPPCRKPGRHE